MTTYMNYNFHLSPRTMRLIGMDQKKAERIAKLPEIDQRDYCDRIIEMIKEDKSNYWGGMMGGWITAKAQSMKHSNKWIYEMMEEIEKDKSAERFDLFIKLLK